MSEGQAPNLRSGIGKEATLTFYSLITFKICSNNCIAEESHLKYFKNRTNRGPTPLQYSTDMNYFHYIFNIYILIYSRYLIYIQYIFLIYILIHLDKFCLVCDLLLDCIMHKMPSKFKYIPKE